MSNEWVPYDSDDKAANPLPEPWVTVWIHDEFYHGVIPGVWADGWWQLLTGSDDLGVTHWKPMQVPEAPDVGTPPTEKGEA